MFTRAGLALACAALLASSPAAAQQASAGIHTLATVHVAPRPLNGDEMAAALNSSYPESLKAAGVSGTVRVSMIVGIDGAPRDLTVISSADSAFDAPTLAAVRILRFSPALVDSQAVDVRVDLPVVWQADPAPEAVAAAYARAAAMEADTMKVVPLQDVTEQPRLLNQHALMRAMERAYPADARREGVQAYVLVRMHIGVDGIPRAISIVTNTDERFAEATAAVLKDTRFRPAQLNGRPVPVQFDVPIQWMVAQ